MKDSNLQDSLPESTGFVSLAVLKSIFSLSKMFFIPHYVKVLSSAYSRSS